MVLRSLILLTGTLFPNVSTDCPAARDPIKRDNFSSKLLYKQIDKIGSGDALLALLSVCLYSNLDEKLSLFIGSLAAAQSVETVGNSVPVSKSKLLKTISHLLK